MIDSLCLHFWPTFSVWVLICHHQLSICLCARKNPCTRPIIISMPIVQTVLCNLSTDEHACMVLFLWGYNRHFFAIHSVKEPRQNPVMAYIVVVCIKGFVQMWLSTAMHAFIYMDTKCMIAFLWHWRSCHRWLHSWWELCQLCFLILPFFRLCDANSLHWLTTSRGHD